MFVNIVHIFQQAMALGLKDEEFLLRNKKLVLLVDLDQTILHTTNDKIPLNLKVIKYDTQLTALSIYIYIHAA